MSFAPIRDSCYCQPYIDGEDYFSDVYTSIKNS